LRFFALEQAGSEETTVPGWRHIRTGLRETQPVSGRLRTQISDIEKSSSRDSPPDSRPSAQGARNSSPETRLLAFVRKASPARLIHPSPADGRLIHEGGGRAENAPPPDFKASSALRDMDEPRGQFLATAVLWPIQKSAIWRLFLSIIIMWPLPLMPSAGRYMNFAVPPAQLIAATFVADLAALIIVGTGRAFRVVAEHDERRYLAEGFRHVIGAEAARSCPRHRRRRAPFPHAGG
jgi:hypothetical protein